ncbi:ABC-type Fe3+/spermidine/putrescine transport system ATPase subunit [Microbacterium testaceum]|nr:ABC-type Fe3+/spermidine/putrescine transport system ATPase subunit [Microbacterium testaceum]
MPLAVRPPAVGRSAAPRGTVSLRGVERTFSATRTVLRGIQLDLAPAEIVTVIGPSGCGKSTLLRLLGGLDSPTAGRITVDGTAVRATDARTAMAFQEPRLLPWRTLAQNVALGLPRSTDRRSGTARVAELLDLVGLEAAAAHRPREVSGGMAQRASLARALARDPEVLLLDEPFGAPSTPSPGCVCRTCCSRSTHPAPPPSCSSRTTWRRRCTSPTGSCSCVRSATTMPRRPSRA